MNILLKKQVKMLKLFKEQNVKDLKLCQDKYGIDSAYSKGYADAVTKINKILDEQIKILEE